MSFNLVFRKNDGTTVAFPFQTETKFTFQMLAEHGFDARIEMCKKEVERYGLKEEHQDQVIKSLSTLFKDTSLELWYE